MIQEEIKNADVLCIYGADSTSIYEKAKDWLNNNQDLGFIPSESTKIYDGIDPLSTKRGAESTILDGKKDQDRVKINDPERINPKVQVNNDIERYLLLLEDDPRSLTRFLSNRDGRRLLSNKRIRFIFLENGSEERLLKQIACEFVFLKLAFLPNTNKPRAESLFSQLASFHEEVNSRAIEFEDMGIKPLKKWLDSLNKTYPNSQLSVISQNQSSNHKWCNLRGFFDMVKNQYLIPNSDLEIEANSEQLQAITHDKQEVLNWLNKIDESFDHCGKLCESLITRIEEIYPQPLNKDAEFILMELDLHNELVYQKILDPLWSVWKYVYAREMSNNKTWETINILHQMIFFRDLIALR